MKSDITLNNIGKDRVRIDGPLKVTGTAPYAYEQKVEQPTYLHSITATIPKGRIKNIDDSAARALPGVLEILTYRNAPKLLANTDNELFILQSPDVHHFGEYIGAVVAQTPEIARHAAQLVRVEYEKAPHDAQFRTHHPDEINPLMIMSFIPGDSHQGDVQRGLQEAAATVDEVYKTPYEYANPMEAHAIIAQWHTEKMGGLLGVLGKVSHLKLFSSSQGVSLEGMQIAPVLGLLPSQIEIISPYVGGGFGSKAFPHAHLILAALAAKLLPGRAVKFMLTRQEMFRNVGHRVTTHQQFQVGARADGHFTAIAHHSVQSSSRFKRFAEQTVNSTRHLYEAPNRETTTRLTPLDIAPASFMRAPGEFTGMFAQETAMDELAVKLGLDPIEMRLRNEPDKDPDSGKPHSSRHLPECFHKGAELFGWNKRQAQPRQRRKGEWLYGMGVASAVYPKYFTSPTAASVTYQGSKYVVRIAAADIGTGAWTILGQIAADALGVDIYTVKMEIGETNQPFANFAGGSSGTFNWGNAIMMAARRFREKYGAHPREGDSVKENASYPESAREVTSEAYGAHFVEIKVSEVTGEVRIVRMLGVYDAGRIINPRTANSQLVGGMVMGISAALHEEGYLDARFGHIVNSDFAGYHIAAHADIPKIEAHWIEYPDYSYGPTGAKGLGEIGIVGTPAAIGNAIFNATGKRLRELPFTPDKLLV